MRDASCQKENSLVSHFYSSTKPFMIVTTQNYTSFVSYHHDNPVLLLTVADYPGLYFNLIVWTVIKASPIEIFSL